MNIINVQNANFRREDQNILTDISWQVKKGEHWALIGLNGAGKTTLLKLINGYIWPMANTGAVIEVLGKRFGTVDLRKLRESIGWVSPSLTESISPSHSVQDVVISGKFATLGVYETVKAVDQEKAAGIMQELGVTSLAAKRFGVCSQGEKQKILIARALMASPRLLILDEPCTGLDIHAREKLLAAIEYLGRQEDGPTIIYITHHIEEVCPVFTHGLIMKKGRILAAGPKQEVFNDELLSDGLDLAVEVQWKFDRAWVQVKEPQQAESIR